VASARAVRVTRPRDGGSARPVRVATLPREPSTPAPNDLRENRGASRRAIRLSIVYAVAIAGVYGVLATLALTGPAGSGSGTADDLLYLGAIAVAVGALGVVVALAAAPRAVAVGDRETVVLGRFGGRYRYPGRAALRVTVLQRTPAGLLSPVPLELVELAGGTARRTFLLDEHLLDPSGSNGAGAAPG